MTRIGLILALSLAASCTFRFRATASLYVRPSAAIQVTSSCPPLQTTTETRPAKTDSSAVWVAGHWRWDSDWVWIEGTWIAVQSGYSWEPPVCVVEDGQSGFHPGYFRRDGDAPPPAYREPGHIRMSCPDEDEPAEVPDRVVLTPNVEIPRNTGPRVARPAVDLSNPTTPNQPGTTPRVNTPGVDRPTTNVPSDNTLPPTGTNPTVTQPGTTQPTNPGITRPGVDRPTTNVPTEGIPPRTDPPNGQTALTCSVLVARVPASGYVTIRGAGFTDDAQVTIAGTVVGIQRRTASELTVGARAGNVVVTAGGQTAQCGSVSLMAGR